MKNKSIVILIILLAASFACNTHLSPNTILSTPASSECSPEKWKISIVSIEQKDLEDNTKLIIARIGIENNDSLWGGISGPGFGDSEKGFLTTEDGSNYDYLDGFLPVPINQSPSIYESTGNIRTVPLPPGFVALGQTVQDYSYYYNLAFRVPASQIPKSITIGEMRLDCILPHVIQENGEASFGGKWYSIPGKTYNLNSDVQDIRDIPSNRKFPNLIGSKLDMPHDKGIIEFTDVSREGSLIQVEFNFTNLSSSATSPPFNGYIIGNKRIFSCQTMREDDCEHQDMYMPPVQPAQTSQGLIWSFIVPEDETNLVFVYVYGDVFDINRVYRIDP